MHVSTVFGHRHRHRRSNPPGQPTTLSLQVNKRYLQTSTRYTKEAAERQVPFVAHGARIQQGDKFRDGVYPIHLRYGTKL